MGFYRVAAPEDDQIAPVLDFAERAGDLAHLLQCQSRRALLGSVCRVNARTDPIGESKRPRAERPRWFHRARRQAGISRHSRSVPPVR